MSTTCTACRATHGPLQHPRGVLQDAVGGARATGDTGWRDTGRNGRMPNPLARTQLGNNLQREEQESLRAGRRTGRARRAERELVCATRQQNDSSLGLGGTGKTCAYQRLKQPRLRELDW